MLYSPYVIARQLKELAKAILHQIASHAYSPEDAHRHLRCRGMTIYKNNIKTI